MLQRYKHFLYIPNAGSEKCVFNISPKAAGGGRGLTRCATEFTRLATAGLTPCSDGKEAAGRRKGSSAATGRRQRRCGNGGADWWQRSDVRVAAWSLRSLLCRTGASFSVARHWRSDVRVAAWSLRSLLCRTGASFSVARHWVRPSVGTERKRRSDGKEAAQQRKGGCVGADGRRRRDGRVAAWSLRVASVQVR